MIRWSHFPVGCLFLVLHAAAGENSAETAPKELLGVWQLTYSEAYGTRFQQGPFIVISLRVGGNRWNETTSSNKPGGFHATLKTDDRAVPKSIDFTMKNKDKEVTWHGIYKVEGDVLTVCRALCAERPKVFKSDEAGTVFVFAYKRLKK